jgi:hypothetical protein
MRMPYTALIVLFTVLFLCFTAGGSRGTENQAQGSPDQGSATAPSRSYLEIERGDYPGLIPLTSYSSEKAKALAQKYRKELIQVIQLLGKAYPEAQLDIQGVGFLKSPKSGENDDRYLSVIVEVGKEYAKETTSFEKRLDDIFPQYVDPIALILFRSEAILKDSQVSGIAICPNWMVGQFQKMSGYTTTSEGVYVVITKSKGKAIREGKASRLPLRKEARIYGRQGDRVFVVGESGSGVRQ